MINKLKIVGSGQKWSVAPCEPFYLLGTEPPAPDAALTGAKNLIEHYGLESAYQKFCGRKLLDELSAFLPHISGNVNMPASEDGSGLLELVQRPPIRGKDLTPFAPSQLDHGFRLHPGPLPHEYMTLFMAPPPTNTATTADSGSIGAPGFASHSAFPTKSATGASSQPTQPSSSFTNRGPSTPTNIRKRRRDVHRGASNSSGLGSNGNQLFANNVAPSSVGPLSGTSQTSSLHSSASAMVHTHAGISNSNNQINSTVARQHAPAAASGPHSGPAPRPAGSSTLRGDPMPSLQPNSSFPPPPPMLTTLSHPDLFSSKSSSQISSLSPNPPAFSLPNQHSLGPQNTSTPPGNPLHGQTLMKNVRRYDDLGSEFTSPEISGPEDERRKKKRKENRYKKERK